MPLLREASLKEPHIVNGFRLRGREVTRLESFSDAVFGFALTLLVVSLDTPRTFADLTKVMLGFPAFAICFLLLAIIWNSHYRFCRLYGLDDGWCRFLTCVMLFLVLFYVYPLKFLFYLGIQIGDAPPTSITLTDLMSLYTIYGIGFAAVYFALLLLYLHAWRLRETLELNNIERFETGVRILRISLTILVGLAAVGVAHIPSIAPYSGITYSLLFPIMRTVSIVAKRKRNRLLSA